MTNQIYVYICISRHSCGLQLSPSARLKEGKSLEEVVLAAAAPRSSCAARRSSYKSSSGEFVLARQNHGASPSPVFHISCTAHWMASPHGVAAGHIYERCIPETYHWPDIVRAQRFESHPALYANLLMERRHFARKVTLSQTQMSEETGIKLLQMARKSNLNDDYSFTNERFLFYYWLLVNTRIKLRP